jgi:nucleoside-diphosphate-sugar epimerase
MAPYLVSAGYDVVGLDTGYYDRCTLVPDPLHITEIRKDIRGLVPADVRSFGAVIHLAALSNDPVGSLDPTWTDEINVRSSARLAELAREAGVRRFLFSSSCIMYGRSTVDLVDERSPLAPRTRYARSKVQAERAISEMADDRFSPVFLRNGTVYGLSPRMRFDTVLNDLVAGAFTMGEVTVSGDGTPWRPVVHVGDLVRSFREVLEAPVEDIHDQTFNNGAEELNEQVIRLAEFASDSVGHCPLTVRGDVTADQRTYRTDFSKFARTFPNFEFRWTPKAGARDLVRSFRRIGLGEHDYRDPRFIRVRWLERLLEAGELDASLRWRAPIGAIT